MCLVLFLRGISRFLLLDYFDQRVCDGTDSLLCQFVHEVSKQRDKSESSELCDHGHGVLPLMSGRHHIHFEKVRFVTKPTSSRD